MANSASGMAVNDECKLRFLELKAKRNHRFIVFKIDEKIQQVAVEKVGSPEETYEDFTACLPANECRYAVFDFDFITDENCQKSKIFFIACIEDKTILQDGSIIHNGILRSRDSNEVDDFHLNAIKDTKESLKSDVKHKLFQFRDPPTIPGMENSDIVLNVKLRKAVNSGTWVDVDRLFTCHQIPFSQKISSTGNTALHAAAIAGRAEIVKNLVEHLSAKDLEIKEADGWTALMAAALTGITPMAKCMVEKNRGLVSIADNNGLIPIVVASGKGHRDMVQYLYENTPREVLIGEKQTSGATLLSNCVAAKLFDVALDLLKPDPHMAFVLNSEETSPVFILSGLASAFPSGSPLAFWQRWIYSLGQLHWLLSDLLKLFGFKEIYDRKLIHGQALELLDLICKHLPNLTYQQGKESFVYKAIFQAVKYGIVEFINGITEADPDLLSSTDKDLRGIFQCAIVHRQENIFSLIYGLGERKNSLTYRFDQSKNNMLHLAGMLAPSPRLDRISGAALQMQRELQWFKEVERVVPLKFKEDKNSEGKTPHELFTENHKKLMEEGEKWMKGTASSCSVVAALIVTIMFAAAFTVPGGNNQEEGSPLFLKRKLFKIFIAYDAISFFSSSTSVLIFLGILTSRYAEKYFLKSLPTKMIIGLTTLFICIATMISAFCAALFLLLKGQPTWVFVLIILPAAVPVILFVSLQFPLLVEIFVSTYGPGIFKKKRKQRS